MSRRIPKHVNDILINQLQTESNKTKLTSIVEIKRPYTVLKDDYFLEKLDVITHDGTKKISDIDIAVSHPRLAHPNDDIYITTVMDGIARVYTSKSQHIMDQHKFVSLGYEIPAKKTSICFENTFEPTYRYQQERVTGWTPWWFYVTNEGSLIAKHIGTDETVTIASEAVTDVSVISGPWHETVKFDYGLCVFFIANGLLMCRQLIKNKWYNAEVISFGPGAPYDTVTANITWDLRLVVTVSKNGETTSLFSKYLGFGKALLERVDLGSANIVSSITGMQYLKPNTTETVDISNNTTIDTNLIFKGPSLPINVINTKSTTVEWGRVLEVEFNLPIVATGFNIYDPDTFELVDEEGTNTAVYQKGERLSNGKIRLTFDGFNNYKGVCTLTFKPGVLRNEFDYDCEKWEFNFIPENLNGNSVPYLFERLEVPGINDFTGSILLMEYKQNRNTDMLYVESSNQLTVQLFNKDEL